jgi:uncharacterized protein YggT (Ycf19 family)
MVRCNARTEESIGGTHAALKPRMPSDLIDPRFVRPGHVDRAVILARVARVIDYLFGILYALLLVRLALDFFGARQAGFVQIIHSLTEPFYAPFRGMFAPTSVVGAHPVVWPLIVAVLAYMLLHAGIRGLFRILAK